MKGNVMAAVQSTSSRGYQGQLYLTDRAIDAIKLTRNRVREASGLAPDFSTVASALLMAGAENQNILARIVQAGLEMYQEAVSASDQVASIGQIFVPQKCMDAIKTSRTHASKRIGMRPDIAIVATAMIMAGMDDPDINRKIAKAGLDMYAAMLQALSVEDELESGAAAPGLSN
jgi:hypothetical protein